MKRRHICAGFLLLILLLPIAGVASGSQSGLELSRRVEFRFLDSNIAEVLQALVQLTGWSIFYDPTQVHGRVTILTPGRVPLVQVLRLVYGVLQHYNYSLYVLTPQHSQPVLLETVLAALLTPARQKGEVVWRNADARDPRSRTCPCHQSAVSPVVPFWVKVRTDFSPATER